MLFFERYILEEYIFAWEHFKSSSLMSLRTIL